jgi:ANTAR domain
MPGAFPSAPTGAASQQPIAAPRDAPCRIRHGCRWPDTPGSVTIVDPGPDGSQQARTDRLEDVRREFDAQALRFEQARARLRATLEHSKEGRSQREILHDSAFARLQARLETMPVIEQAKGIVMAQNRCGPQEAFDLLRRASQRANVKISVLAAHMVEQIALPESAGDAHPARPASRGHP